MRCIHPGDFLVRSELDPEEGKIQRGTRPETYQISRERLKTSCCAGAQKIPTRGQSRSRGLANPGRPSAQLTFWESLFFSCQLRRCKRCQTSPCERRNFFLRFSALLLSGPSCLSCAYTTPISNRRCFSKLGSLWRCAPEFRTFSLDRPQFIFHFRYKKL